MRISDWSSDVCSSDRAAGSMDLLRQHNAPGNSHRPRDSSRFRNWKPDGDYLIASEAWTSGGARPAAARPPVPTADEVAALERIATEARARADTAARAVEQLESTPPQQCRDVPRVVNELSGFHASRQEAELRAGGSGARMRRDGQRGPHQADRKSRPLNSSP